MPALIEKEEKSVNINIRAPARKRALIDRAAELKGKTRTEFMLETACEAAEAAILDQTLFVLDDARYQNFIAILNAPAQPNRKLKALLARKALWEK